MSRPSPQDYLSFLDFRQCSPACSVNDLNERFVSALLYAQHLCGFRFVITSGYRSQDYERSKGRKGTSSHCRRLAVDISAIDSHARFKIVSALLLAGLPRIGIGERFVHVDFDESKPHPILFHYYTPQNT